MAQDEDLRRGINIGVAICAATLVRTWGETAYARELLGSAGLESAEDVASLGVDEYDVEPIREMFSLEAGADQ